MIVGEKERGSQCGRERLERDLQTETEREREHPRGGGRNGETREWEEGVVGEREGAREEGIWWVEKMGEGKIWGDEYKNHCFFSKTYSILLQKYHHTAQQHIPTNIVVSYIYFKCHCDCDCRNN